MKTSEVQHMVKNAQKQTVKRRHEAGITFFILGLARDEHLSAGAIVRAVEEKFESGVRPKARTVQDMVREVRSRPRSGAWQIWDAEPEDAVVVLGALAELMRTSFGRTTKISQEDARWIIRLSRAGVGDLPPGILHDLAIQYQLRGTEDVSDLDALIAFTPWRSERAYERYRIATEHSGWIPNYFALGPIDGYDQLLIRLGFRHSIARLVNNYDDALALEGGTPHWP